MFRKVSQSVRHSLRFGGPMKSIDLELTKQWLQENLPSKDPLLSSVSSIKELYKYLKSGHILCRIIGFRYGKEISGVKAM